MLREKFCGELKLSLGSTFLSKDQGTCKMRITITTDTELFGWTQLFNPNLGKRRYNKYLQKRRGGGLGSQSRRKKYHNYWTMRFFFFFFFLTKSFYLTTTTTTT
jgi:hypothetical protein